MAIQRGGNGPTLPFNTGAGGSVINAIDDPFLGNALVELNEIPSFFRTVLHHTTDDKGLSWILNPSFEEPPLFDPIPNFDLVRHPLKFFISKSFIRIKGPVFIARLATSQN